jgi:hypothetical protein
MTNLPDKMPAEIRSAIQEILFHDWDPLGMVGTGLVDEYDYSYEPVYRILVGSRSEQELTELLFILARDYYGVASDIPQYFEIGRPAARRLLESNVGLGYCRLIT